MDKKIDFEGEWSCEYDALVGEIFPGYTLLNSMVDHLLGSLLTDKARLLIAGSGTGNEIIHLAEKHPSWSFVGVDPAEAMYDIAMRKVENHPLKKSIQLVNGYIDDVEEKDFDAATSLLVMHFLPDDGAKLKLLMDIGKHLQENATLILVDLVGDPAKENFSLLNGAWRQQQLSERKDPGRIEEEFLLRSKEVHFVPEERMVSLFREAGYLNINRFFQTYLFCGYIVTKA